MTTIRIVDNAPVPGGRFIADGPYSGEWFREEFLRPAVAEALSQNDVVNVELDGAPGYGSSFLEESFGGLIRNGYVTREQARQVLRVQAKNPLFRPFQALVERYIKDAQPESAAA